MGRQMKRVLDFGLGVFVVLGLASCGSTSTKNQNEYLTGATLWFQTSGEARALLHQTFRLARMVLDNDLKVKRKKGDLPPAIVVDVDETVLDNSPFEARVVLTGEAYPKGWNEWISAAKAKPLIGAVEFLTYAHSKGYRVFYVTNRNEAQKADTLKNLQEVGFPDASEETLMVRSPETNKEPRRQKIRVKHRIAILLGDNLNDLDKAFDQKTVADRLKAVEAEKAKFGGEYIVIPNPMYGDWEGAIYNFNFTQPDEVKYKLRRDALTSF